MAGIGKVGEEGEGRNICRGRAVLAERRRRRKRKGRKRWQREEKAVG